jgi:hypothetical protein
MDDIAQLEEENVKEILHDVLNELFLLAQHIKITLAAKI